MVAKSLLIVFALTVCAVAVTPAQAQSKDPNKVKSDVDAGFGLKVNKIKNFQSSYLLTHGKFYQALWSHGAAPADGNLLSADKLLSKPTYQNENLQSLFDGTQFEKDLPNRFKIDWYDGPGGKGYSLTIEVVINGITFQRVMHLSGNETWREQTWFEVKPITP